MLHSAWFWRPEPGTHSSRGRILQAHLALECLEGRLLLAYAFTLIADTGSHGPYRRVGVPAISSQGGVAFEAHLGRGSQAILRSQDGVVTTIADSHSAPILSLALAPTINGHGEVVFGAFLQDGGFSYLAGDGNALTTIADTDHSLGPTGTFSYAQINDAGQVVFNAPPAMLGGVQAIQEGDGGPLTVFAEADGPCDRPFGYPAINNAGVVAFQACVDATRQAVLTGADGRLQFIADTTGPWSGFSVWTSINDAGQVALVANRRGGGQALLVGDGGPLTTVADTSGPFSYFDVPAITNTGQVFFVAGLASGEGPAIYAGTDPVTDRVIAVGDRLFGSAVTGFNFTPRGVNDAGQVTFKAHLADGRLAVIRADPVGAPGRPTSREGRRADLAAALPGPARAVVPLPRADATGALAPAAPTSRAESTSATAWDTWLADARQGSSAAAREARHAPDAGMVFLEAAWFGSWDDFLALTLVGQDGGNPEPLAG